MNSIEGGSSDPWPPSPPFQELSIEDRGNSENVALLVGMAGKCHWSAAIFANDLGLEFDLACRTNGASENLKSSYKLVESLQCSSIDNEFQFESDSVSGRIETMDGCELCFAEKQFVEIHANPSREKTVRWKYQIYLHPRDQLTQKSLGRK